MTEQPKTPETCRNGHEKTDANTYWYGGHARCIPCRKLVNRRKYSYQGPKITPAEQRFWAKVDKSGDCWEWTGSRIKYGYGSFRTPSRTIAAHRFAYILTSGPIPTGLFVCHHCDNPPCVRPDHLFLGTCLDNARDMIAKGRAAFQKKREAKS